MGGDTASQPNEAQAAVVLAAGAGRRFRAADHKLLADFRGRPVVVWAMEAAVAAGFAHTIVVGGAVSAEALQTTWSRWRDRTTKSAADHDHADMDSGDASGAPTRHSAVTFVDNAHWEQGQSTSLQAAVAAASAIEVDAIVVGLGDQPLVNAASWRAVAAAPTPIAICVYGTTMQPPVRLHRSVWPLLPSEGDFGARHLVRLHPELVSPIACTDNPLDIDTVEDLRQWS